MSGVVLWFMFSIFHSSTSGNHFAKRHKAGRSSKLFYGSAFVFSDVWAYLLYNIEGILGYPEGIQEVYNFGTPNKSHMICTGVLKGFKINLFKICTSIFPE